MTDIVDKLREGGCSAYCDETERRAADEIVSLRARLAEWEQAHILQSARYERDLKRLAEYERDFVASCSLHAHAGLEARLAEAEALLREWVGCGTEYQHRKYRVMQVDHDTHNQTVAFLGDKP